MMAPMSKSSIMVISSLSLSSMVSVAARKLAWRSRPLVQTQLGLGVAKRARGRGGRNRQREQQFPSAGSHVRKALG